MKIEFSNIDSLQKLAKGGQGTIYKVPPGALHPNFQQSVAVKKYKNRVLEEHGYEIEPYLTSLVERRKNASADAREIIDQYTIWPKAVVYENGQACGFVMNLIPERFFARIQSFGEEDVIESNFDVILHPDQTREQMGLPIITGPGLAKITFDLLRITATLHRSNIVVGDISPNNILVSIDPASQGKNRVLLIDADSFRPVGGVHPLKQPHTPAWFPPEAEDAKRQWRELERNGGDANEISRWRTAERIQNTQTDTYKICLAITRLYHNGPNRTVVPESAAAYERLARGFGSDFADLIQHGIGRTPSDRPTGQELLNGFTEAVKRKRQSRVRQ